MTGTLELPVIGSQKCLCYPLPDLLAQGTGEQMIAWQRTQRAGWIIDTVLSQYGQVYISNDSAPDTDSET
jgi:hypothetical protein